jgi:hypothetical protein
MLKVYHSAGPAKFGASFTAIYQDRYTTRSPFSIAMAPVNNQTTCKDALDKRSKGRDTSGNLASVYRISNPIEVSEEKHGSR